MQNLYEKNELLFAFLWIGAYLALGTGAGLFDAAAGTQNFLKAIVYGILTGTLLSFVLKNGYAERFGLCKCALPLRRFLWFLPLAAAGTANLWAGVALPGTASVTVLYVVTMAFVGLLEELLFRGLLLNALKRQGEPLAVVLSSLAFGLMHLLNLCNGTPLLFVLCQTVFATLLGFLFAVIVTRGKSLLPCIAAHCLFDVTSVFTDQAALTPACFYTINGIVIGVMLIYLLFLHKTLPKQTQHVQPTEI